MTDIPSAGSAPASVAIVGRAFVAALSVAVTGMLLAACGSDINVGTPVGASGAAARVSCAGKDDLTAEGSTAQQNAIAMFNQVWGRLCPGKNLSYNPTGSGQGREQFIAGHVDFGGADSPLTARQIDPAADRCNGNPAWNLPVVWGPVALAYNLPGVGKLVVNADALAKIFNGTITMWNDPALTALNPGAALPGTDVVPIYRSDSSGTTDNFQKYLAAAAPQSWAEGVGTEFQGGVGEGTQKSAGVVQAVQATPGAIGYVEKGFADQADLPYALINTGSGEVAVSDDSAGKAIDAATFASRGHDMVLDLNSMYATKEPGAYPLVLATYEIVCSKGYDRSTSAAVKSFLTAAITSGQGGLAQAGYVRLPDKFKQRLLAAVDAIK